MLPLSVLRRARRPLRLVIFLAATLNVSAVLLALQPLPLNIFGKREPLTLARLELESALVGQIKTVDSGLDRAASSAELEASTVIPAEFKGQTLSRVELPSQEKVLALTFDDGPWRQTPQVLEILKKYDIKATFFIIGSHIQSYPKHLEQIAKEGHAIGNHTWNHHYHSVSAQTAAAELGRTADAIEQITGSKTVMFRPPGGNLTNGLVSYATQNDYVVLMWSVDSRDYISSSTVGSITQKVVAGVHPGAIVLLHDGGGNRASTVEALPQMIEQLQDRGYRFVTVPELLELKARTPKPTVDATQG